MNKKFKIKKLLSLYKKVIYLIMNKNQNYNKYNKILYYNKNNFNNLYQKIQKFSK